MHGFVLAAVHDCPGAAFSEGALSDPPWCRRGSGCSWRGTGPWQQPPSPLSPPHHTCRAWCSGSGDAPAWRGRQGDMWVGASNALCDVELIRTQKWLAVASRGKDMNWQAGAQAVPVSSSAADRNRKAVSGCRVVGRTWTSGCRCAQGRLPWPNSQPSGTAHVQTAGSPFVSAGSGS